MTRHSGTWPMLLLLGSLPAGCGSGRDEQPVDDARFPYQSGDATVCGEDAFGFEAYRFEVIRAELAADAGLRRHVRDTLGLERVETCEDARLYMPVRQAYKDSHPEADEAPESGEADASAPIEEFPEVISDKVAGVAAEFPPAVHLWTIGCSGFLIGPRWLLTAAHCRPSSERIALTFVLRIDGEIRVVTPCSIGANAYFAQSPGYVGKGDWTNDFAVIEADCDFPPPADTPDVWARISRTSAWPRQFVEPLGWGRRAHDGTGSGELRRGEHGIYVSQSSRYLFSAVAERGRARICAGDSGGPAVTFTALPGAAVVMGMNLYHSGGSEYCPYPGDVMGFLQLSSKTSWIGSSFAIGCNAYRNAEATLNYWRCW